MQKALIIIMAAVFMAGGASQGLAAETRSASCYVAAEVEETTVFVRALDADGNPLEATVSGWVAPGKPLPVDCRSGKIVIQYRPASSDKSYQTDPVSCSNGRTISVP
jgi:hypothetical protein